MSKLIWKVKYTYHMYRRIKWLALSWKFAGIAISETLWSLEDDPEDAVIDELSRWLD